MAGAGAGVGTGAVTADGESDVGSVGVVEASIAVQQV